MSDSELEGSQHLYPVSLDDPARQYVASHYPVSSRSHWIVDLHMIRTLQPNGLTREDVVAIQRRRLPISLRS
jgi:hypothetical protein